MKREKVPASPLGDQLRTFAAAYAASGQRDKADGLVQASYTADAHAAGTTTGIVDPIVEAMLVAARAVVDAAERITAAAERITETAADLATAGELAGAEGVDLPPPSIEPRRRPPPAPPPTLHNPTLDGANLDSGQVRVLVALRQCGAVPHSGVVVDRRRLALLTEYTARGGRFLNILSSLRSRGLIVGSDPYALTDEGTHATSGAPPLPSGRALLELWLRKLPKASADILGELAAVYPRKLTPEAIASRIGREAKGGSFLNALGRLRTLHLAHGKREVAASHVLFEEPAPRTGVQAS